MRKLFFLACLACCVSGLYAQPSQALYEVVVSPNHADWTYKVGEEAEFELSVLHNRVPVNNIVLEYEYGPEKMPVIKKESVSIKNSRGKIKVPGMKQPGFQMVSVKYTINGRTYSANANIGYDPDKIKPTQTMPTDFVEFWDKAKADAARIPLEPMLTLQPELCTSSVNIYHIRFQNDAYGSYIYGMLTVPKKPGKYPAVLQVPGAGLHSFSGNPSMAAKGIITLEIGIHGIPVNLPREVYPNLASGALNGYALYNLDDKDKYYFKRAFIGCQRAIDFIFTLDAFDGTNVGVMGGSQGGALSIVTAALDTRIKCFASRHPGSCDLTGFLHNRPGGWPGLKGLPNLEAKIETSRYYDVVNFAKTLKVPGFFTWGYNDPACPPTTTFSAYNVVSSEKVLKVYYETAHWHFPEQNREFEDFVLSRLGVGRR